MKRYAAILLSIAMLLTLSACGGQKTVPEQILQWEIEDYFKLDYVRVDYNNYSTKVTHSPDHSTNTDTVSIELTVNYPHSVSVVKYEATYQYDKSKDLWEFMRGDGWGYSEVVRYNIPDSALFWEEELLDEFDCECEKDLEWIRNDLKGFFNCELPAENIIDYWEIFAESYYNWSDFVNIFCFACSSEQGAQNLRDQLWENAVQYVCCPVYEGENYKIQICEGETVGGWSLCTMRVDNNVFLLLTDPDSEMFDELLYLVGIDR